MRRLVVLIFLLLVVHQPAYTQTFGTLTGAGAGGAITATYRAGYQTWDIVRVNFNTLNTIIKTGTGSPEGAVTANVASLYGQTDGADGTAMWMKVSGSGNTGWRPFLSNSFVQPRTTLTHDIGSNTLKWNDVYAFKVIVGDSATQANNAMIRHRTGSDPNGMLTVAKGDESALGDLQVKRLSVNGDTSFPVSRFFDVQATYTGADFSAGNAFAHVVEALSPSANLTKYRQAFYAASMMQGTHTNSGGITGIAGEAYWNSTGNATSSVQGVSSWVGGSQASPVTIAQMIPLYGGGSVNTNVTATQFIAGYIDRAYSDGAGTITDDFGLWLEDRRGYQTDGGTVSGLQHPIHYSAATGTFFVDRDGQAAVTGLQLIPNTISKPTCNSGNRGKLWYVPGGAGVADTWEVCRKDVADVYAWVSVY